MNRFDVTARTDSGTYTYTAIAPSSFDAHADALDIFGLCHITVMVRK